jgi:hypothetical protein
MHEEQTSFNVMTNLLKISFLLSLSALIPACNEGPSGVEQRVVELEAMLAAKEHENIELLAKLDATKTAPPNQAAPVSNEQASTRAGVYAAASILADSMKEAVKPRTLNVSGEVAYAGFTTQGADGVERGVTVPFFREGDGSSWRSGWSKKQILAALGENAAAPVASQPETASSATPPSLPKPPEPTAPKPMAEPAPTASLPGLPARWTFDSTSNEVVAPNGARMPPAPPGWKYGIMEGSAGDTPRAYIQGPQGQRKYYVD